MTAKRACWRGLKRLCGLLLGLSLTGPALATGSKPLWDAYAIDAARRLQRCFNVESDTVRQFHRIWDEQQTSPESRSAGGMVIRIWLDKVGRVERFSAPALGDLRLDALLRDIVLSLPTEPPPAKMPMPLLVAVKVGAEADRP